MIKVGTLKKTPWTNLRSIQFASRGATGSFPVFQLIGVAAGLMPRDRLIIFRCRNTAKNQSPFHLPYLASSRAFTISKGMTSSGWSRWSWRRRSINSASPGASSSSNRSRSCSKTSRCSSKGSFSNRPITRAALLPSIYSSGAPAQGFKAPAV